MPSHGMAAGSKCPIVHSWDWGDSTNLTNWLFCYARCLRGSGGTFPFQENTTTQAQSLSISVLGWTAHLARLDLDHSVKAEAFFAQFWVLAVFPRNSHQWFLGFWKAVAVETSRKDFLVKAFLLHGISCPTGMMLCPFSLILLQDEQQKRCRWPCFTMHLLVLCLDLFWDINRTDAWKDAAVSDHPSSPETEWGEGTAV